MTEKMLWKDEALSDDRYTCYHPIKPVKIFDYLIEEDELSECEIHILNGFAVKDALMVMDKYLEWLQRCEKELVAYFENLIEENLPEGWFEGIEVYSASMTIDSAEDYGITIAFGEEVFPDHAIELDFVKEDIVDNRLIG